MLRLGRVHDGLMVDMRASNEKLRARGLRMLRHLTGADEMAARRGAGPMPRATSNSRC